MTIKARFHHSVCFWVLRQIVLCLKKPSLVPLIWADLGLIVINVWNKVIWSLLFSLKKNHFLFHNLWPDLFLCQNSFIVFTLIPRFDFSWLTILQMVDHTFGAWTTSFGITGHKLHFGVCWALNVAEEMASSFWVSLIANVFKLNAYD